MTRLDDDEIARDRAARRVTRGGRRRWPSPEVAGPAWGLAKRRWDELPFSIGI
jgi:hypothetical protein